MLHDTVHGLIENTVFSHWFTFLNKFFFITLLHIRTVAQNTRFSPNSLLHYFTCYFSFTVNDVQNIGSLLWRKSSFLYNTFKPRVLIDGDPLRRESCRTGSLSA